MRGVRLPDRSPDEGTESPAAAARPGYCKAVGLAAWARSATSAARRGVSAPGHAGGMPVGDSSHGLGSAQPLLPLCSGSPVPLADKPLGGDGHDGYAGRNAHRSSCLTRRTTGAGAD